MSYTAADVGDFYDDMTEVLAQPGEGNIHWGYWHSDADPADFAQATVQMNDQMIARLAPEPGQRVLDIGCGTGTPALQLARAHDVRITGTSESALQVKIANRQAVRARLADRVTFQLAEAMRLPFLDGAFDAAWAVEWLAHMRDRRAALREIARVLRPGARLAISDFFLLNGPVGTEEQQELYRNFCLVSQINSIVDLDSYRAMLEAAGLRVLEMTDVTAHTRQSIRIMAAPFFSRPGLIEELYGPESRAWLIDVLRRFEPSCGYVLITAQKEG